MSPLRKWMIPAAGMVMLVLALWGVYGTGTARRNLPEKAEPASQVTVSELPEEGSGEAVQKYNAAIHRRSKPLADPFHMDALVKAKEIKEVPAPKSEVVAPLPGPPAGAARKDAPPAGKGAAPSMPVLKGILSYKGEKRAILEMNGSTDVMREGEKKGIWTVSEIQEKAVILSSNSGMLTVYQH